MSQVYGNCMNCWLPSGIDSMLEPMHADRMTSKTTYVHNRFHPYSSGTIYRKKYAYESFLNSRFYHGIDSNIRESTEGSYLLPSGGHGLFSGPSLQNSLQRHHTSQQTKSQWNFIPTCIQNLHALNTDIGTSLQVQSSVSGKDKSHPFYSRVRSEPAEGMTRTRDKYRVVYTEKQRRGLEKEYSTNKFITTEIRARISEELGLSSRQIKIWFQNRRAKERRDIRKNKCSENIQNDGAKDTISNEYSNSNNANDFLTSCRFNGNDHSPEQSPSFNERCQFSNYTENHEINASSSSFSEDCFLESRACIDVRASVSPSGLYQFTGKSYLPAIDVSPLTGNKDFGFDRRF